MMKNYKFEELKPKELGSIIKKSGIVYLPLGTLEWHERHLPFGVDAFIGYAIAQGACKVTGGCIVPPVYFGTDTVYEENGKKYRGMNVQAKKVLSGSIYPLDNKIFYSVLKQILVNLKQQGFKKVVVISGHCESEQMKVLNRIQKTDLGEAKLIVFPREGVFFRGGLDHAGEIETSLMMTIKPEIVDLKRLQKPYIAIVGKDPYKATKNKGKKQLKEITTQLIELVNEE